MKGQVYTLRFELYFDRYVQSRMKIIYIVKQHLSRNQNRVLKCYHALCFLNSIFVRFLELCKEALPDHIPHQYAKLQATRILAFQIFTDTIFLHLKGHAVAVPL